MNEFSKKIKRVQPIIKTRQSQLDTEAVILSAIRNEKKMAMRELKKFEGLYTSGVEQLNSERQSSMRDKLNTLESSLDHVKNQWYKSLKKLRELEQKEKAQIAQLLIAERNLKSVEKLEEKYVDQVHFSEKMAEQKANDEMAIRKFSHRK